MDLTTITATTVGLAVLTSLVFAASCFIALYIPGRVALRSLHSESTWGRLVLALSVGLVFWAVQGVIVGYLHMRWLTYIYLVGMAWVWFRYRAESRVIDKKKIGERVGSWQKVLLVGIFVVGVFGQVNRFIPTGFVFDKGIYIYTGAADDAFWHASLTAKLSRQFPPDEPGLVSVPVTNYHYWSNIVAAEFVRVFYLPVMAVQFIYLPVLSSLLLGGLSFLLARQLGASVLVATLAVYLQYFASDIIYLFSFVMRRQFIFTVHPLEDGTMFWENPPRALSFVVTLLGIILLLEWRKVKHWPIGLFAAVALGTVIGYKVHTGIMVLGSVAGLGVYFVLTKQSKQLWFCFLTLLISLLVYIPVNGGAGLPVFAPFEMSRMFAVQEKIGISFFELRRRIYHDHFNSLREWQMDLTMLSLFLLGQFGIRNLGWLGMRRLWQRDGALAAFVLAGLATTVLFGTLFIQPVAYADIFNSYLAGSLYLWILTIGMLMVFVNPKRKFFTAILSIFLIAVTMPRWIYKTYIPLKDIQAATPAIWGYEVDAMREVKKITQPNDVILVFNTGQWDSMYPYVSIFTERPMYLSGITILERHGIPLKKREDVVNFLKTTTDQQQFMKTLKNEGITVLYFYDEPKLAVDIHSLPLTSLVNTTIHVYKVQ